MVVEDMGCSSICLEGALLVTDPQRKPLSRSLLLGPELVELARARQFVADFAGQAGFPDARVFDITVAVSEAAANAIEHAPVKGEVMVTALLHADRLEIQVEGPGQFQAPHRLASGHSHRGLGLPLMAQFSDHLALYSGPRGGTLVSLTFYRPGGEPLVHETMPPSIRELIEENELVSAIAENAPVGLYVLDVGLRYKWANPAYRTYLDEPHRSGDLTGLHITDVVPGIGESGALADLEEASRSGVPLFPSDRELTGFSRGRTWWRRSIIPLKGDRGVPPYDVLVVVTDETERIRAASALSGERGGLENIMVSLPVGFSVVDAWGRTLYENEAARTIWGGQASERGQRIDSPDMPLARALRGETVVQAIVEFERLDGTRGTQVVTATPIRKSDGEIDGAIAIVQDASARS
jgi:PAS domain-containing protein